MDLCTIRLYIMVLLRGLSGSYRKRNCRRAAARFIMFMVSGLQVALQFPNWCRTQRGGFAHGQMGERELERVVWHDFINGTLI